MQRLRIFVGHDRAKHASMPAQSRAIGANRRRGILVQYRLCRRASELLLLSGHHVRALSLGVCY